MSGVGSFTPCLMSRSGAVPSLGDPLVDEYLRFSAARVRANTLTAQSFDLKVFFTVVAKPPQHVTVDDQTATGHDLQPVRLSRPARPARAEPGPARSWGQASRSPWCPADPGPEE